MRATNYVKEPRSWYRFLKENHLTRWKAYFYLNEHVSKQNCRIWGTAVNNEFYLWSELVVSGKRSHPAQQTIELLRSKYSGCIISRNSEIKWSFRSWNLTPLNFLLWDDVKWEVYADNSQTNQHLKENILRVITDIEPTSNVTNNFARRMASKILCSIHNFLIYFTYWSNKRLKFVMDKSSSCYWIILYQ